MGQGTAASNGQPAQSDSALARRMFDLVEPIGAIPYSADEPNEAMFAVGFTNYWDTYFAGRAAPLGSGAASRHFAASSATSARPLRSPAPSSF